MTSAEISNETAMNQVDLVWTLPGSMLTITENLNSQDNDSTYTLTTPIIEESNCDYNNCLDPEDYNETSACTAITTLNVESEASYNSHPDRTFTVTVPNKQFIDIDKKNLEIYQIFEEDHVGHGTIDKIVRWYNLQKNEDQTPLLTHKKYKTKIKKNSPFRPFKIDTCINVCYAFPDKSELQCPECHEARYTSSNSTATTTRTTEQLKIAPQLASLFTNAMFLRQCEKPIDTIIKGSYIKDLQSKGLFQGKYDIGLVHSGGLYGKNPQHVVKTRNIWW
ncbi:uncharacterized protein EV154DRAFT_488600 [Mucor mucedo]|uniref:uncharacterized protein n=1 Tax=Mucor mucedo TaxID=29922 RepID=UPI00221E4A99|nr:uncharacterized protein EV154DRAFT_488600 [Mucor mucedo]KAI7866211.1 hypothetical protein EV154DRAFT_488600 [Mucor mucedo]